MTAVLVMLGAAVGAPLRYLTDRAIQARTPGSFPWGTLTVNVVGSLVLGVVIGATLAGAVPWREASGNGLSLATGYAAASAILESSS